MRDERLNGHYSSREPRPAAAVNASRVLTAAFLIATVYYPAALIGNAFRLPGSPISAFFPPNAVLLTGLLLFPVRQWPLLLGAAIPAHIAVAAPGGVEWWQLAWQLFTNFLLAALTALALRAAIRHPLRLDSLRDAAAFFGIAVILLPCLTSFLSAGFVVLTGWSDDYWVVWEHRSAGTALSHLLLVPLFVATLLDGREWLRRFNRRNVTEGVAILAGLLVSCTIAFEYTPIESGLLPIALYAPLIFLLWAAVRFGPPGGAAALLCTSLFALWSVLHGQGPFSGAIRNDPLHLQIFLLGVSLPVLLLAAVVRERQRAAAALAASERQVRQRFAHIDTIYRTAPVGLAFVDTDLRFVDINDQLARFNGLPADEHRGRTLRDVLGDLAGKFEPLYRQVIATGTPLTGLEVRGSGNGSGPRDWQVSYHPVKDEGGSVVGVTTVVQEITERKRAEEALKESHVRLANTLESISDAFFSVDREWRIRYANRRLINLVGKPAHEVIGMRIWDQNPELFDSPAGVAYRRAMEQRVAIRLEVHGNSSERWYNMNVYPTEDGLSVFALDITDRKRSAEALRESEARFRALFESNVVPIAYWHMDGHVLDANDAYLRLVGQTRRDLETKRVRWDELMPGDAFAPDRRTMARLRSGILTNVPFEKEYQLPDGRRLPVLIAGSLLPGYRDRGLAFAIDLTQQKQTEQELARLNAMLERERRRLDDIIANVPGVVWETWTEPQGFIKRAGYVSEHVRTMVGYTPVEWLSKPSFWLSIVHEEDRERAEREAVQFILGLRTGVQEFRWVARDGRVLWVESHLAPIRDETGRPVGLRGITLDVTERRKAQIAREESEARSRAILKAVPDLMFVLDNDGVFLDYYARDPSDLLVPPEHFLGRNQTELFPPELDRQLRRAYAESRRTGDVCVVEYAMPIRGEIRWFEARISAFGAGQTLSIVRDITVRKRAEQRLVETQTRYALAIAAGRVTVWSYDADAGHVETDALMSEALTAHGPDPGSHRALIERMQPEDVARAIEYEKLIRDCLESGGATHDVSLPEMEHRVLDKEGNIRWFLTRGAVARGGPGEPTRVLGTATEITALKKAEQWLRESEARFRALAETVPDIIFTSLADGFRDYVNPQFYAYTGLPVGSALGFGWAHALHPEDREREHQEWLYASRSGAPYESEYRLRAPDGSYRWYFGRSIPLRSDDGRALRWVSCATDITDRKLAEDTLHASTEALRRSKEEIQQFAGRLLLTREEEHKQISIDLHDDLNQQVAALAISLSTLKRQLPGSRASIHDMLESIQQRTEELSNHIRDLSHRLHSATLHHVGLVPALRSMCYQFGRTTGIEVRLDIEDGLLSMPEDVELCLYRVAEESLRNVAQHSDAESVRITLNLMGDLLDLRIIDDGRGFDLTEARVKGGLGLISMEERIRLVDGNFDLITAPGAGATIVARVPLEACVRAPDACISPTSARPSDPSARRGTRARPPRPVR